MTNPDKMKQALRTLFAADAAKDPHVTPAEQLAVLDLAFGAVDLACSIERSLAKIADNVGRSGSL